MPKYLIQASYSAEGFKGLHKDKASGRRKAVAEAVQALEGKLEAFYFAFGKDDVILLLDLPDNVSVSALAMAAAASGLIRTRTTPLLSVEEADRAIEKGPAFRAPGR